MLKKRVGPDNCIDGNLDTKCTTKNEPYPTVTLDFGKVVDIGQVSRPGLGHFSPFLCSVGVIYQGLHFVDQTISGKAFFFIIECE